MQRHISGQKHISGFSLIELMIVVAIIGILAVFAIPSYLDYAKRARFSEVIAATEPFKLAVALALQQGYPVNEINTGAHNIPSFTSPSANVANITVANGEITATGTDLVERRTYILSPTNREGTRWKASGTCALDHLCEVNSDEQTSTPAV